MKKCRAYVFGFCLFLTSALFAENWPAWRGENGLGITSEENLPLRWSATENTRWKIPLPERGNSTPIIWKNKIFITQAVENRRTIICFDRANGQQLWQTGTVFSGKEQSHEANPPCSASPVTDGGRVIAWFGSAGVLCCDLDGKKLWEKDLGPQQHEWGYAASPVIHDDLVFINFGPGKKSFLIALNKKTGKTVWQKDIPQLASKSRTDGFAGQDDGIVGTWSTPLIIKTKGRDELILSAPEKLLAFDPKTGKELWHCDGLNPLVYGSPIYGEDVIVAMGGFHGTTIAVKTGGNGDVTATHKLWETKRTKNRLGCGVIFQGNIYVLNTPGVAECIDLKTGKTIWEERLPSIGPKSESWSSMILSGDKIYILNQSGDTVVLRASTKYEVLATNSIGNELTNASHAVSDGELFIRTHKNLWCIGENKKAASTKPLKALFLTGGGYHDYQKLAPHLTNSLGKLLKAEFDVRFDMNFLKDEKFADAYDVIIYDFCFDEAETALLKNAIRATQNGKPAVMIHCAVHAFRNTETIGEWESYCGMKSKVHDPYQPFATQKLTEHPATKNFPADWKTPGDELYQTIQFFPGSTPLLKVKSPHDGREHIVCWAHQFGKGRVFATTLGHDMKTAELPDYIRLLADGILWACEKP